MLDRANQGQYTLDAMKTADRRGDGQPKITSFTCQGYCVQEGMVAESWCQQETLTPKWLSQQDCKIKFRLSQVQNDGTVTKLLHSECTADVQETINVFKEWNPSWQPTHFMVDFSEVEIAALEEEFPDSKVLPCDFHREKAWIEWFRKRDHGVSRSAEDSLLRLLRNVAKAATAEEYAEELQNLQSSDLWMRNENLRTWFGTKWIPQAKRWVRGFRDEELKVAIHTNNGVEHQNETLKHSYLQGYKNCSLSEMLTVVTSEFLSNIYRKYIELNVRYSSSYRQYTTNIPQFL
ncbi:hypothetical protein Bbelb_343780 [Branchiostoma belcheri]|nr:hypothetical protein Bbelb_343780 [Branchiostoma belcheri]